MSNYAFELQRAIVQKLLQSGPLMALVNDRVFKKVPANAGFPRIEYGSVDATADNFDCIVSYIAFVPLHVWSNTFGNEEALEIAGMIRNILHEEELSLGSDFRLQSLEHDTDRFLTDPDGATIHAVVTFRAMIDELPLVTEGGDVEPAVPFLLLDAQNESYQSDGADIALADALEEDGDWGAQDPPYVVGADGFTTLRAVLKPAYFAELESGFTVIVDLTPNNLQPMTGENFNVALLTLPDFDPLLQLVIRESNAQVFHYTGSETWTDTYIAEDIRGKAAFVAVPGDKWSFFWNGQLIMTDAVGTPVTPPTDIGLFTSAGAFVVHSLAFHQGALTDEQCEDLTTL